MEMELKLQLMMDQGFSTTIDWFELVIFFSLFLLGSPLLGRYMAHVFEGEWTPFYRYLSPFEKFSYRICKIDPTQEMTWKTYLNSLVLFNILGFVLLFLILTTQHFHPWNPQKFPPLPWALAFNTAASFVTNTNWQAYAGETTLSYASQMVGLTVQNFLSAATGSALFLALVRGIFRNKEETLGNFWCDLVRMVIYILLPLSILVALILIGEGVIQSLNPYVQLTTIEGLPQTIPLGPVASQEAIKMLGTNGGGFFNTNSAHPFENPSALSNFLETYCILIIPGAFTFTYGHLVGSRRQGIVLYVVMLILLIGSTVSSFSFQHLNEGPYMEGKESRIGIVNSLLWSNATTTTANGSVNAMLSSLSPLSGGIALFNILLGEIGFGGIGVGMCGMLMFIFITVFLAGLMVGRTPEYLGKKIEKREVQWVMIAILAPGLLVLLGSGFSAIYPEALKSLGNKGPHGLTEIVYAFASATFNNGSAFASLDANTDYFNITLGTCMIIGRLLIAIPTLALAGSLVVKRVVPISEATFKTDSFLFGVLLLSVILIVGALTFFPTLALGPIVENFLMLKGRTFS